MPLPGHKGLEGSDAENISLLDWKPCAWRNPMCAAQSHYSFVEHYKAGSLGVRRERFTSDLSLYERVLCTRTPTSLALFLVCTRRSRH